MRRSSLNTRGERRKAAPTSQRTNSPRAASAARGFVLPSPGQTAAAFSFPWTGAVFCSALPRRRRGFPPPPLRRDPLFPRAFPRRRRGSPLYAALPLSLPARRRRSTDASDQRNPPPTSAHSSSRARSDALPISPYIIARSPSRLRSGAIPYSRALSPADGAVLHCTRRFPFPCQRGGEDLPTHRTSAILRPLPLRLSLEKVSAIPGTAYRSPVVGKVSAIPGTAMSSSEPRARRRSRHKQAPRREAYRVGAPVFPAGACPRGESAVALTAAGRRAPGACRARCSRT